MNYKGDKNHIGSGNHIGSENHILYYEHPASHQVWEEALPLGNGSLGAMIYGSVDSEIVQLNQESVWYGGERSRINPNAFKSLDRMRQLLSRGNLSEAEQLAYTDFFGTPMSQGHYEPLANLHLVFYRKIKHHSELDHNMLSYKNYHRQLDLQSAMYTCSYELEDDQKLTREAFTSYVDDVLAIRLKHNEKSKLSFRVELERGDMYESVSVSGSRITLKGSSGGGGSQFVAMMNVVPIGGTIVKAGAYLEVEEADEAIVYVTGRTDFYGDEPEEWCHNILDTCIAKGYARIKKDHLLDYQKLYNRVSLQLADSVSVNLPIDKRLKERKNNNDIGLVELYFNFARYLMISSSRPGNLPGNLQGIWNHEMIPPWGCKYTININTQMNYWPAESLNLSECHEPLFKHIKKMNPRAKKVARDMYGCQGAVAHHNTDIYGDCAPQDQWMPASLWPMGYAWLCLHIIEHYRYTRDHEFIEEYIDILLDGARFFFDFLIGDDKGQLVTSPSTSPENTYILENGEKSALCYGPIMDSQIICELWEGVFEISGYLSDLVHAEVVSNIE